MATAQQDQNQQAKFRLPTVQDFANAYQGFKQGVQGLRQKGQQIAATPLPQPIQQSGLNQVLSRTRQISPGDLVPVRPTEMRGTIKSLIQDLGSVQIKTPLGVNLQWKTPEKPTENLANFARGMLRWTPYQSATENIAKASFKAGPIMAIAPWAAVPAVANEMSKQKKSSEGQPKSRAKMLEEATAPTDQRGQMWEDIGASTMGYILAYPLMRARGLSTMAKLGLNPSSKIAAPLGALVGSGTAATKGSVFGSGFATIGALATEGRLPTTQELKEGGVSGAKASWMLAFTDTALDKVLQTTMPALYDKTGFEIFKADLTQAALNRGYEKGIVNVVKGLSQEQTRKALIDGTTKYITRALLESPTENVLWTADDILSGREKRDFLEAYIANLPRQIVMNLIWGGLQVGLNLPLKEDKTITRLIGEGMKSALVSAIGGPKPTAPPVKPQVANVDWNKIIKEVPGMSEETKIQLGATDEARAAEDVVASAGRNPYNTTILMDEGRATADDERATIKGLEQARANLAKLKTTPQQLQKKITNDMKPLSMVLDNQKNQIMAQIKGLESDIAFNTAPKGTAELVSKVDISNAKNPLDAGAKIMSELPPEVSSIPEVKQAVESWSKQMMAANAGRVLGHNQHPQFQKMLQDGKVGEAVDYARATTGDDKQVLYSLLKNLGANVPDGTPGVRHKLISESAVEIMGEAKEDFEGVFLTPDGKMVSNVGPDGKILSHNGTINYLKNNGLTGSDVIGSVEDLMKESGMVRYNSGPDRLLMQFETAPTKEQFDALAKMAQGKGVDFEYTVVPGTQPMSRTFGNWDDFRNFIDSGAFDTQLKARQHEAGFLKMPEMFSNAIRAIGDATGLTKSEFDKLVDEKVAAQLTKDRDLVDMVQAGKENEVDVKKRPGLYTAREDAELRARTARMYGGFLGGQGGYLKIGDQLQDFDIKNIDRLKRVAVDDGIPLTKEDGSLDPDGIAIFNYGKQVFGSDKVGDPDPGNLPKLAEELYAVKDLTADPESDFGWRVALDKTSNEEGAVRAAMAFGVPENTARKAVSSFIDKVDWYQGADKLPAGDSLEAYKEGGYKPASEKYVAENINQTKLIMSDEDKEALKKYVDIIREDPDLKAARLGPITDEEIIEQARIMPVLNKAVSRAQFINTEAEMLNLRRHIASFESGGEVDKESFKRSLEVLRNEAYRRGRSLGAMNIEAEGLTANQKLQEKMIVELVKKGVVLDDIIEKMDDYDLSDASQAAEFYRLFVRPTRSEWIDEFRYINLLSAPKTHIVNAVSNIIQTTITAPMTRLYAGGVDMVASSLTGKERQHYASSVSPFYKGLFNSLPEASRLANEALEGKLNVDRPDITRIPVGKTIDVKMPITGEVKTISNPLEATKMNKIVKLLEASDIFFRTVLKNAEKEALAYEGEQRGMNIPENILEAQASKRADYYIFRQGADGEGTVTGQGKVLQYIDKGTQSIYSLRRVPGVKWFVPFVQTPMNILKQGYEYSPLGVTSTIGMTDGGVFGKEEQFAKALFGSTLSLMTVPLALTGRTTWTAPSGKDEKAEFYASGRVPFAVKIGDSWYSYSRLGPLAYPIAMTASMNNFFREQPGAYTDSAFEKSIKATLGMAKFFSDQSFVRGLGDLVNILQGEEYAWESAASNIPRQLIPLTSLMAWTARLIDPYYREGKNPAENIMTDTPGLSFLVDPYLDPAGQPSKRRLRFLNAFTPVGISPSNPEFEPLWQARQIKKGASAIRNAVREGKITIEKAQEAADELLEKMPNYKQVKKDERSSLWSKLVSPAYAAETPSSKAMTFMYTYNPQLGVHVDAWGNPGPLQPGPEESAYVYEFGYNEKTGYYEDQWGNPSPMDIFVGEANPEVNLDELSELPIISSSGGGRIRSGSSPSRQALPGNIQFSRGTAIQAPRVKLPSTIIEPQNNIRVGAAPQPSTPTPNFVQLPRIKAR